MAFNQQKATRAIAALRKAADSLEKALPKPAAKPTAAAKKRLAAGHRKVAAAHAALGSALGLPAAALAVMGPAMDVAPAMDLAPAPSTTSTFDQFFTAVGASFANAQRSLDQRTKEYLAEIQDQPEFPRTAFRIGKVAADMKFSISDVNEKSVGIIFFSEKSSTDVRNEQSVHFEMVAAPLPPGGGPTTPSVSLVFSSVGRAEVFKALDGIGPVDLMNNQARVLIYAEDPGKVVYLAFADATRLGMWRLELQSARLIALRVLTAAGADLNAARATVETLGNQQEAFLKSLG